MDVVTEDPEITILRRLKEAGVSDSTGGKGEADSGWRDLGILSLGISFQSAWDACEKLAKKDMIELRHVDPHRIERRLKVRGMEQLKQAEQPAG